MPLLSQMRPFFAAHKVRQALEFKARSGNQLQEECRKDSAFAYGYIFGLLDGTDIGEQLGAKRQFCLPSDVSGKQIFDVVCRYVDAHPESRQWSAGYFAVTAMRRLHPYRDDPLD